MGLKETPDYHEDHPNTETEKIKEARVAAKHFIQAVLSIIDKELVPPLQGLGTEDEVTKAYAIRLGSEKHEIADWECWEALMCAYNDWEGEENFKFCKPLTEFVGITPERLTKLYEKHFANIDPNAIKKEFFMLDTPPEAILYLSLLADLPIGPSNPHSN